MPVNIADYTDKFFESQTEESVPQVEERPPTREPRNLIEAAEESVILPSIEEIEPAPQPVPPRKKPAQRPAPAPRVEEIKIDDEDLSFSEDDSLLEEELSRLDQESLHSTHSRTESTPKRREPVLLCTDSENVDYFTPVALLLAGLLAMKWLK